jgi:uncharacterized membrane protein YkvI
MGREFRYIIKVASIYMAAIIGAGFASGQEIVQFFTSYYRGGFFGILLAGVLFSLIGAVVLDKVYTQRIRNYDEFIFPSVGYFFGWVMQIAVTLFMLSLFSIMLAGMGNILNEKLGIPFNVGVMLMVVLCLAFILNDIKGIVLLSTLVTPVMIIGIPIVGFYILAFKDTSVFSIAGTYTGMTHNWLFSALLYVSYNSLMATVILSNLLPYLKTRRVGIVGGILGGVLLCAAAFILNAAIFFFYPHSISKELPVLGIIEKHNTLLTAFYTFLLGIAMFSSAVTSGYCFIDRVKSKLNIDSRILAAVLCLFAIPMAGFSFSGLIASLYPLFGYVGLFLVFIILLQWGRNLWKTYR